MYRVTHVDTGRTLTVHETDVDAISQSGFYAGVDSPYRVEPRAVVDVFPFLLEAR